MARENLGRAGLFHRRSVSHAGCCAFHPGLPKLKLLAMDFPNIDATKDMVVGKPAPNHQIILKKPVYLLENLNIFSQLAERIR
jgi:kynurenine formamidase